MIYAFGDFELDADKVELRRRGAAVPVEPQVFALILLLAENSDRMVSKDEIVEKIWDGRVVSEAALTSRIRDARRALGDDGRTQNVIRTVHGKGFRFVAALAQKTAAPASVVAPQKTAIDLNRERPAKPSIAVLPFRLVGVAGPLAAIADALPHELIAQLSRLRWLFVIARGSSFRFRASDPDICEIGAALGVRYCLSGVIEVIGEKIGVTVELADTSDGAALWGERFAASVDDIHNIRDEIVAAVVAALEIQIPLHEARAAQLAAPENLDAWSAYHLGLQHLYRFNKKDNEIASTMFKRAIKGDPGFARAHAGLSSTHFQNAFLNYNDAPDNDRKFARQHAERSVELDPLDPFANFAMGRVHWIENNISDGFGWLDRSISLCPNYAQGVYARAWADTITGRGEAGDKNAKLALSLSPLDPFRYAFLGVRAMALLGRGDDADAARLADEAARTPGAHVLIAAIALAAQAIHGDEAQAAHWAENVRARKPDFTQKDFFEAFPFEHDGTRRRISNALAAYGF